MLPFLMGPHGKEHPGAGPLSTQSPVKPVSPATLSHQLLPYHPRTPLRPQGWVIATPKVTPAHLRSCKHEILVPVVGGWKGWKLKDIFATLLSRRLLGYRQEALREPWKL